MKTNRKKYRIKNKFRFITALTVLLLLLAFAGSSVLGLNQASGSEVRKFVTVQVKNGDTLWDLARTYGPSDADCRRVIYEIEKINGVDANTLQAGQYITIPAERL